MDIVHSQKAVGRFCPFSQSRVDIPNSHKIGVYIVQSHKPVVPIAHSHKGVDMAHSHKAGVDIVHSHKAGWILPIPTKKGVDICFHT